MHLFRIPRHNPDLFDHQFAQAFPGLNLIPTSNSGAFWGDGDLRARSIDHNQLQFAVESKVRYSSRYKHCEPSLAELVKAEQQLRKRNAQAIRLLIVSNQNTYEYGVSLLEADAVRLEREGFTVGGETKQAGRGTRTFTFRYLGGSVWEDLYDSMRKTFAW